MAFGLQGFHWLVLKVLRVLLELQALKVQRVLPERLVLKVL
jgi:hypothetical protein